MGYRLQAAGECEERLSDSVAPEHLSRRMRLSFGEIPAHAAELW